MSIEAPESVADIPQPPEDQFSPQSALRRTLGAFVTLETVKNQCGVALAISLGESHCMQRFGIWRRPQPLPTRFPALTLPEWPGVSLDISVLDELRPCPSPEAVEAGRHGLVLVYEAAAAYFCRRYP